MLQSINQQIWKTQQWPQDREVQFSFQSQRKSMPKNVQTILQLCSFHMLARLCSKSFKLHYVNRELPDVQAGFRKCIGTRDQITNICRIVEKARKFQKKYFCFIDYVKAFDSVNHNKLWKIHKEMEVLDYPTCLLRNLNAGQEATVRTGCGIMDWFKIGKGVRQGCMMSPCLFNLYAEYIM